MAVSNKNEYVDNRRYDVRIFHFSLLKVEMKSYSRGKKFISHLSSRFGRPCWWVTQPYCSNSAKRWMVDWGKTWRFILDGSGKCICRNDCEELLSSAWYGQVETTGTTTKKGKISSWALTSSLHGYTWQGVSFQEWIGTSCLSPHDGCHEANV